MQVAITQPRYAIPFAAEAFILLVAGSVGITPTASRDGRTPTVRAGTPQGRAKTPRVRR